MTAAAIGGRAGTQDPAEVSCVILPGGGSAGLNWVPVAQELNAKIVPLPVCDTVEQIAAAVRPQIESISGPITLIGASLGGMVALELSRVLPVRSLVLAAAGFGIDVGQPFLDWIGTDPQDLFPKLARVSLDKSASPELVQTAIRDWESRGAETVHRHLSALQCYRPEPLSSPPPSVVLWGEHDRAVPRHCHAELARQLRGILVPLRNAGHMPFLEQSTSTLNWIRRATHPRTIFVS